MPTLVVLIKVLLLNCPTFCFGVEYLPNELCFPGKGVSIVVVGVNHCKQQGNDFTDSVMYQFHQSIILPIYSVCNLLSVFDEPLQDLIRKPLGPKAIVANFLNVLTCWCGVRLKELFRVAYVVSIRVKHMNLTYQDGHVCNLARLDHSHSKFLRPSNIVA